MKTLDTIALWLLSVALWVLPGVRAKDMFRPPVLPEISAEHCPASCGGLFRRLRCDDDNDCEHGKQQNVDVQERGEPKSGTGFMYEWATGALGHACAYLAQTYGEGTCWVEWEFSNRTMIFDPSLAADDDTARCPCHDVQRVKITILNVDKHALPVTPDCEYSRRRGMALKDDIVCAPAMGEALPTNRPELWACVKDSNCRIVDDHLQLAVFRDPRPLAVSAYFHELREHSATLKAYPSVDVYVVTMLPKFCQWVSVRYLLFGKLLRDRSAMFWYDDALDDPVSWHTSFFEFVGLNMPEEVLKKAVEVAKRGGKIFGFPAKGMDRHDGGAAASRTRSYRDELNSTTLSNMDDVLRMWLPDSMLEKINVSSSSKRSTNQVSN